MGKVRAILPIAASLLQSCVSDHSSKCYFELQSHGWVKASKPKGIEAVMESSNWYRKDGAYLLCEKVSSGRCSGTYELFIPKEEGGFETEDVTCME
jgi:hypothetical protein